MTDMVPCVTMLFFTGISLVYQTSTTWPIVVPIAYVPLLCASIEATRYIKALLEVEVWYLLNGLLCLPVFVLLCLWFKRISGSSGIIEAV